MNAQPQEPLVSEDEFWELVEKSDVKLEHIGGRVYAMAAGGYVHARLIRRLNVMLDNALFDKRCATTGNEFFVEVESTGDKHIPDAAVHCENPRFGGKNGLTLLNPVFVAEVLSPKTRSYDQQDKFDSYSRISSLKDYLLVWTDYVKVSHYTRQDEGWLLQNYYALSDVVRLPSIEVELPLERLYAGMNVPLQLILFPQPESDND